MMAKSTHGCSPLLSWLSLSGRARANPVLLLFCDLRPIGCPVTLPRRHGGRPIEIATHRAACRSTAPALLRVRSEWAVLRSVGGRPPVPLLQPQQDEAEQRDHEVGVEDHAGIARREIVGRDHRTRSRREASRLRIVGPGWYERANRALSRSYGVAASLTMQEAPEKRGLPRRNVPRVWRVPAI